MIRRLPDWPERLAAYIAQRRTAPFAWGSNDCALFAAGAVHACTGAWLLPESWCDARAAARVLRRHGGLASAVDAILPRLPNPALARRGDLLLAAGEEDGRRREWLAVADAGGWLCPAKGGLAKGRMSFAVCAWGVGHG